MKFGLMCGEENLSLRERFEMGKTSGLSGQSGNPFSQHRTAWRMNLKEVDLIDFPGELS